MTIDWTQPVIDARDMDADPLFDSQGRVQACRVGSVVYASPAFEKLGLRNVSPPKPEPVLREAWVWWNSHGRATVSLNKEWCVHQRTVERGVYAHVAVMSDGSPVPGAEATALEIEAARDAWRTRCKQWAAKASEWAIEKDALKANLEEARCQRDDASARVEALQAEVDGWCKWEVEIANPRITKLGRMYDELQAEVERMKPVVDAAVEWEKAPDSINYFPVFRRISDAVRIYLMTKPKKTAAEAVANVAEMMGPVKNCATCRWFNSGFLPPSCKCCSVRGSGLQMNWEAKSHD